MEHQGLTFAELREASLRRQTLFTNARGERVLDGGAWSLADWVTAAAGELGEAANIVKKIRRGDFDLDAIRGALADELADVAVYLDLLAEAAGIDLGEAVIRKFNRKSMELGLPAYLPETHARDRRGAER